MEFTRSRKSKQSVNSTLPKKPNYIVKSKQPLFNRVLALLINILMWAYTLTVIYFFIGSLFNSDNWLTRQLKMNFRITNTAIRSFMFWTFVLFLCFFGGLLLWRHYNKRKFGSLKRRIYPGNTTQEDLMGLDLVDVSTYLLLQSEKVIIFETNPIKGSLRKGPKS